MALIEVRKLVKAFGPLPVLRGIDFDLERGESLALLGANGGGKSTLIRLIAGLTRANAGTITVGGWSLPNEAAAVRAQIGLVAHRPLVYDALSGRENLRFFARLYDLNDADARIESLLHRVGLTRRADALARDYSRGMQQRLAIARALLHDPAILLLDEPYTGLDIDAAARLDTLIADARAEGRAILLTTHDLDRVGRLADRALILVKGRVGYDGAADDVIGRYQSLVGEQLMPTQ